MKLSFKYNVKNINSIQQNIISDLVWHIKKVSNMLLYDIREGKEKLDGVKIDFGHKSVDMI